MILALEIPLDDRFVGLARHLAAQAARRADFSEDQVDDVRVVASEVVSSAMDDHRRAGATKSVRMEIEIGDPFELVVYECGEHVDLAAAERSFDDAGLGLAIAHALVDDMRVEESNGGSRIVVTMGRRTEEASA